MSILADIYNGKYQGQASRAHYPQELRDKDMEFWDKENLTDIHHFREGFKLGVRLMLEVYGTQ